MIVEMPAAPPPGLVAEPTAAAHPGSLPLDRLFGIEWRGGRMR